MKKINKPILIFILIFSFILASCNFPGSGNQGSSELDSINTSVAQTVTAEAQATEDSTQKTTPEPSQTETTPSSLTDTPTEEPTESPTVTEEILPTNTPEPTNTPLPCNMAEFVKDVTVPDGKDFLMGDTFTKTWRLKNVGSCAWTSGYDIVFEGGDKMGAPDSVQLTSSTVDTGETVDVSVDLTAPDSPGKFRGNWKLRDPEGQKFGIENSSSGNFWVEIEIDDPGPVVQFDLHAQAPSATWISGAGTLSWDGADGDSDGFAKYKDGEKVEGGATPDKVLEMHPEWVNNGVITGRFPSYTVEDGDHFKAKIGFLTFSDGTCGAGDVEFQFNYKQGGTLYPLESWMETCDGSLTSVDIDLSSLAGESVKFIFAVQANGPATQDWAVWIAPRIEN